MSEFWDGCLEGYKGQMRLLGRGPDMMDLSEDTPVSSLLLHEGTSLRKYISIKQEKSLPKN